MAASQSPPHPPSRLPSLTGLRFVAAALVFLDHARFQWSVKMGPIAPMFVSMKAQSRVGALFGQGGSTGVGFFFILSGFVLAWAVRPSDTAPAFWRRRIFKIFPNHVLNVVVLLALMATVSGLTVDKGYATLNLFLLHAWFPKMGALFSVNPMAWSLSCEATFYLCFPLLAYGINRIRPQRLWAWTTAVVVAILLVPTVAEAFFSGKPLSPFAPVTTQQWFIYFFPPIRMLEFVLGILLARIVLTGRRLPLGLGGAVALAVAAYAVQWMFPTNYSYVAIMALPLGLVLAAAAVTDVQGRSTSLGGRAMVWLGNVSFAFYLWHYPVLAFGNEWLGGPMKGFTTGAAIGREVLYFVVALALSALVYTFVEDPVYRRFASSRRARTTTGSAVASTAVPNDLPPVAATPASASAAAASAAGGTPGGATPADPPAG